MNFNKITKPDDSIIELIRKSGDEMNVESAHAAQRELAVALTEPLRQGILVGDVTGNIFERRVMTGMTLEFPLDLLAPGEEAEHVAYTNPGNGRIPEKTVEADYVMVPTYSVASSIDWLLRHAAEARWDLVGRAMQILEAGFVKKMNDDAFHVLLTAGVDRNLLIFDADATDGQFTKRLISLMKTIMRRNAGGNTGSLKRGKLTDLYTSPEALEDVRGWGLDQLDDTTRREIYIAADGGYSRIFNTNIHDMDELGENQEYQLFFTNTLGATLNTGDLELVIGLDQLNNDSFLMPIKQEVTLFNDPTMHRRQMAGFYGWCNYGVAALDIRRILLGCF